MKGAMLTHRNLISGLANCDFYGYDYYDTDVYLSYVPMNHVYEQIMLGLAIVFGYRVGFLNQCNYGASQAEVRQSMIEDI